MDKARRVALSLTIALSCGLGSPIWSAQTLASASPIEADQADQKNKVVMDALQKELDRSFTKLKNVGPEPLYFISYAVYDIHNIHIMATYGGLQDSDNDHSRRLHTTVRVGSKTLDNTHSSARGSQMYFGDRSRFWFPVDNDSSAIRDSLWLSTDSAVKQAQQAFSSIKANKETHVEEEDTSDDFSESPAQKSASNTPELNLDIKSWEERIRKMSAIFKEYPEISESQVELNADRTVRYFVSTEGASVQHGTVRYKLHTEARAVAKDGMVVNLYDAFDATTADGLPTDAEIEKKVRALAQNVVDLSKAPAAEPYVGPAILQSRAASVFFHEVLGHRVEGHRQKQETEGRTFTQKVGEKIMPPFISVYDDPTLKTFKDKPLAGNYAFDDEGVPAQKVTIVDKGVLKGFLMSRSPVKNFPSSNGHGRCMPGASPVARQGNLIVDSSKRIPYTKLKAMLLQEVRKQKKPYGLIIDEISGGFTSTSVGNPQAYSLLPLRVTRIYADGRPDELSRGVNIVGTPLNALENIVCAGNDDDTFNGVCGAESGWVPVAATSPSLFIHNLELEKRYKEQDKPPILPSPLHDPEAGKNAK